MTGERHAKHRPTFPEVSRNGNERTISILMPNIVILLKTTTSLAVICNVTSTSVASNVFSNDFRKVCKRLLPLPHCSRTNPVCYCGHGRINLHLSRRTDINHEKAQSSPWANSIQRIANGNAAFIHYLKNKYSIYYPNYLKMHKAKR
jgi:hypothetical protein